MSIDHIIKQPLALIQVYGKLFEFLYFPILGYIALIPVSQANPKTNMHKFTVTDKRQKILKTIKSTLRNPGQEIWGFKTLFDGNLIGKKVQGMVGVGKQPFTGLTGGRSLKKGLHKALIKAKGFFVGRDLTVNFINDYFNFKLS